ADPRAALAGAAGEIARAAARLGARVAVRSSASIEDGEGGAAPGLFTTVLGVAPAEVAGAAAEVIASAGRPAVRAYLTRRRGRAAASASAEAEAEAEAEAVAIAVVVQRQVGGGGAPRGALYTRAPGLAGEEEMWLEVARGDEVSGAAIARAGGAAASADPDLGLGSAELAELARLGLAAERAIGAEARGADVEWVMDGGAIWLVQARPIPAGGGARAAGTPEVTRALAFSRGDRERTWRWDASHNPDPLSRAQAGLVE